MAPKQQVSPFRWPLLSMFTSRSNLPARKSGNGPYSAIDLSTHGSMFFRGHFTHAVPLFVHVLLCVASSLKFPGEGGGGRTITVGPFCHVPSGVWGNRRAPAGESHRAVTTGGGG